MRIFLTDADRASARAALARWAGLVVLAALAVYFFRSPLVQPLRMLAVLFHEAGHVLAAVATGGRVEEVAVQLGEGGYTKYWGGSPILVTQAGYLGSLLAGLGLVALAKGPARVGCSAVGLFVLGICALMPALTMGQFYAAGLGCAFVLLGVRGAEAVCRWVLRGIGVFSVLYALADVHADAGVGDAAILAARTGVPAIVWTGSWLFTGVALVWVTRRWIL
ncbi:MAG: M50 family metallopeptidase [Myxococcota bacterium]